jgi:predicted aspartyl protease
MRQISLNDAQSEYKRGSNGRVRTQRFMFLKRSSRSLTLTAMVAVALLGPTAGLSQIPRECLFEPDWRPTNIHFGTIHVIRVDRTSITVAIREFHFGDDGNTYTLDSAGCRGRDCSGWTPTAGADYPGMMSNKPKYTPGCMMTSTGWHINDVQKDLPAIRTLSFREAGLDYDISAAPVHSITPTQPTDTETLSAPVTPKPTLATTANVKVIPMLNEGGVYVVPVLINKTIVLKFVVDSGAADVSIPADVVTTLMRAGTITQSDFVGAQTYTLADGSTTSSRTFRIRSLKVGDIVLQDVLGSVANSKGDLLLGQSALGRFKSWSMDNRTHALVLTPK